MQPNYSITPLPTVQSSGIPPAAPTALDDILALLRERTGCDFSRYRVATVYRRIATRMISLGVASFEDYLQRLRSVEDETARLLERLTIKVSRFYRNPATFDLLRARILPELAERRAGAPVRVWSAGCGFGQEPYTLAMLLDDAGIPGVIEASDIDPAALAAARVGLYTADAIVDLPAALAQRYLQIVEHNGAPHYRVVDDLRARVRFSRGDITADTTSTPATFDLICCRNVLIYLQRDIHEQTLRRLRHALVSGGYLCLGEAEWPSPGVTAVFESLGRKTYLFRALG